MLPENSSSNTIEKVLSEIPHDIDFDPVNPWLLSTQYNFRSPHEDLGYQIPVPWVGEWYSTQDLRYLVDGKMSKHGGMSFLHKAWDRHLNKLAMLKFTESLDGQGELAQREALTMGRLLHPHVMPVIDFMKNIHTNYGVVDCFVMPFIDCQTVGELSRAAQRNGFSLPIDGIRYIIEVTGNTLYDLYFQFGISHRDVKPGNLLLSRNNGNLLLTDFGAADGVLIVDNDTSFGTPAYMVPEIALGHSSQVDSTSDVYSLGLITYELLVGKWPYADKIPFEINEVLSHICFSKPISLFNYPILTQQLGRSLTKSLDRVLSIALSKSQSDRFPTTVEYLNAVIPLINEIPYANLTFASQTT